MAFPEFFAAVPAIVLRDPLAELLGASDADGIEYCFADAVKLAGHACPTVAGAWLLTVHALRALYPDALPERGNISVVVREKIDNGVAGVMGSVAMLLTGAAGEGGFKGLGGRHARCGLLRFGVAGLGSMGFARNDSGAVVAATLNLGVVPADPQLPGLLTTILQGRADALCVRHFRMLWQDRVRRILLEHHDDPALVQLHIGRG